MTNIAPLQHTTFHYACVIENNEMIYRFKKRGIKGLYYLFTYNKKVLKGAKVSLRHLGKASAALLALAKAESIHADTVSTPALKILHERGITVTYTREVPFLINDAKTDWCPMEKLCRTANSLNSIVDQIRSFLSKGTKRAITLFFIGSLFSYSYAKDGKENYQISDSTFQAIDEITVTGSRNEVETRQLPLTISMVSGDQINQRYQPSVLPILNEQVPGLFITSNGVMGYGVGANASGTMSMRGIGGSPTTRLLMLVDGEPQYMGLMGHPLADVYQSTFVERVEVVRGPASVLYGSNAMGGVINIVTPKITKDSSITKVRLSYGSYNTQETNLFNRYQKGKFSSKIAASYNHSDGHRANMDFNQLTGYAKVAYSLNDEWQLTGNLNYTDYTISNPGSVDSPVLDNDSHIKRGMSSLSLSNKNEHSSGATMLFYNWGKHAINDGYQEGSDPLTYRFNSTDKTTGLITYQSFQAFENNTITIGADIFHFGGVAWKSFTTSDATFTITDTTENELATYVDVRQNIGELLTLDAGLRYDYHSQAGGEWIPQAGLSAHLAHNAELKAMVSKGFRNPTLKELYMFGSQNPDLKPESILNYELAFQQKTYNNTIAYGLNIFYLKGDNLIQTIFANGSPLNVNTGAVENHGFEASFSYHINQYWSSSANYSYLDMKYPIVAAPQHKAYFSVAYHKNKLSINSGWQYINGLYTSTEPQRTENFMLWNANAAYQLRPAISLFIRGENLLNQDYEINNGYTMPGATFFGGINVKL